jgi:leucyl-tRNA synthetase
MILAMAYRDVRGALVPNDLVEARDGKFFRKGTDEELTEFPAKMSKALKNVVNPDEIVGEYGADSFRLYEMFMGPLEATKPWQTRDIEGVYRFLHRVWKMVVGVDGALSAAISDAPLSPEQERLLHETIRKVDEHTATLNFNTAISQMMVFVNEFGKAETRNRAAMEAFVLLLAPYAPHLAEELWERLGHATTLAYEPYPKCDETKLKRAEVEIVVQIQGKPRAKLMVPAEATAAQMESAALADPKVRAQIEGKTVVKVIAVPGRLVNLVVR